MTEEWRPIPDWPYEVSSLGRVRRATAGSRTEAGKIIKTSVGMRRYREFTVYKQGSSQRKTLVVHRVVCSVFHGPKPGPEYQVRHLDGDRDNNCADNLCWGTAKENSADSIRHGVIVSGKNHPRCIYSDDTIREVRRAVDRVRTATGKVPKSLYVSLSNKYGIPVGYVSRIVSGKRRPNLT